MGRFLTEAKACNAASTSATIPYDDTPWSLWGPSALAAQGGTVASCSIVNTNYSYIAIARDFQFNIPLHSRVDGVIAVYNIYKTSGTARTVFFKLQDTGGVGRGSEYGQNVDIPTNTGNLLTLGSATDRWGLTPQIYLAPNVVNHANFGIQFACVGQVTGTNVVNVDYMTLQLAYATGVPDTFDRADGAPGSSWADAGIYVNGIPKIYSNRLVSNINTSFQAQQIYWAANSFEDNQWSEGNVYETYNMQFGPHLLVRAGDGFGYWVTGDSQQAANGIRLYKKLPGQGLVQLGSTYTGSQMDGRMRLEASGSTSTVLDIYRNGTLLFSYTDSTNPILSGAPGVGMHESYNISSDVNRSGWTDWQGGPTVEGGTGMVLSGRTLNSLVMGRLIG